MKVAIVSSGNKDYFLGNQTLVDSIPDSFEYLSFDNQDKNLGVMVIEEKNQVTDNYVEQLSDTFFKTNMKKRLSNKIG